MARPIDPTVDQLDPENRGVGPPTPDPDGHLGLACEAVALIQQDLSVTRQNPTMMELSPTPMSGSWRFPSLVEESPSLGAYPNPPSRSRLNPTIMEESPAQIEEDECYRWFSLGLEQGGNDEEKMKPDRMVRSRGRSGMGSNIAWHRRYNDCVDRIVSCKQV